MSADKMTPEGEGSGHASASFLSHVDLCGLQVGEVDAAASAVLIAADAKPRHLVAIACTRLLRLAEHMDMLACRGSDLDDVVRLSSFVQPQIEEACALLQAAEVSLREATA